jgi:hypothetical protein
LEIAMKARLLPVLAVIALAGCSKVHHESSFTVEAGNSHNVKISAPVSEQKVKVVVTADKPINVWIILEKDVPGGKDEFDPESIQTGIVAKEKNTKEVTLEATIPAKESYRIYINGPIEKANVTVKIDSQ